jgi:hypothetical protein
MSYFQSHIVDISLSHCGFARIVNCGSNLSATSNVTCFGTSASGIISVNGMIIRGDATPHCKISGISRGYSKAISDVFVIELRAGKLQINLDSLPSRLYLGSPFSISCT